MKTNPTCNFGQGWDAVRTTPVGEYSPKGDSPYGCVDMSGNVWEWCLSEYRDYPYDGNDGRNSPNSDRTRVVRGGSFGVGRWDVRAAVRVDDLPDFHGNYGGFRAAAPIYLT
ncbi:MAG: SUMF1/EgtB/PvdO family nonheme iron enzyme [Anaerolineae bacterium]|nr:SUMF1/EgtB/PvdO family nonheme iron enzyme [Anaerolineae bacterium]